MKGPIPTICGENFEIKFDEPISGITAGQACVLYDIEDQHLLGGGII
jgi:tRNA U34 2-thiouridine synthase MnmA/TrmU